MLVLLACALLLSGCDVGPLNAPEVQSGGDNGDLFASYVALGNSITAGFQSGGINENLQRDSYAALLADQMNTPFGLPVLSTPGCPPLKQIFPPERISDVECALRESSASQVRNVAVPGARVLDALASDVEQGADPNELTNFILGGQTQIQAATARTPTFASIRLGNNDVLGAALAGTPNLITPPSDFESKYETLLDSLENSGAEGGAIGNVFNVTQIPNLSPGAACFAAKNSGQLPPSIDANSALDALNDQGLIPQFPNLSEDSPTFGSVFSEDGIHPNSKTHQLIASKFIDAINSEYGTSLSNVDSPSF